MKEQNIKDMNILTESIFLCYHMAEQFIYRMENILAEEMKDTEEYKAIKKKHGKLYANRIAKEKSMEILKSEDLAGIGKLREEFKKFHFYMDKITDLSVGDDKDGVMFYQNFNATEEANNVLDGTKFYCRLLLHTLDYCKIFPKEIIENFLLTQPKRVEDSARLLEHFGLKVPVRHYYRIVGDNKSYDDCSSSGDVMYEISLLPIEAQRKYIDATYQGYECVNVKEITEEEYNRLSWTERK